MPYRRLVKLRKGKHNLLATKERSDEHQDQEQETPLRREIDPARLQQPPASAERALADRIEDHVVFLIVLREVLRRVVDDPGGAQAPDQLHVLCGADRGDADADALQELDRR
jgi:hypothetical protein